MKLIGVTFLRMIGLTAFLAAILTVQVSPAQTEWQKKVIKDINDSKFEEAKTRLQDLDQLSPEEGLLRDWYYELMRRIRIEFPYSEEQIKEQLAKAGYETDDAKLRYWESKKYLEMRPIDGVRFYFKNAVPNLPRLDPELQKNRVVTEYDKQNSALRLSNCERIIEQSRVLGQLSQGRHNVFTCVAKIPANKKHAFSAPWKSAS